MEYVIEHTLCEACKSRRRHVSDHRPTAPASCFAALLPA